ncbi:hypothetical protein HR060_07790 [Catenovulum sp. SM1970]|uniref:M14 family zinc carboxypeptidase n=1 Tax=Marinifaba aquimaris TaxID=2741323 RepID=UPI00157164A3|nr:M14 family zinc carboxypeptidase [Marinifaba aquimaris]NTS76770.1 hypothetical protein [Marinifaba aquimaris]
MLNFKRPLVKLALPLVLAFVSPTTSAFNEVYQQNLAALSYLTKYDEINNKLTLWQRWALNDITSGPLIDNDNNGLIDIDINLDPTLTLNHQVCGEDQAPTIRQAVICTNQDGLGGNTQADKIGFSTQGRTLLAVRAGNPAGKRVMVITQQHGNEPAATEAALSIIRWLSFSPFPLARNTLEELDLLFVVRANPDGGEPDIENCEIEPVVGGIMDADCAFIRQNVDPSAGGGYIRSSEANFAGIVGRGYDLNRYHHGDLNHPIRPVETQALVAATIAFQPEVILDLHGDMHKSDCQLDYSSIQANQVLGVLPTGHCHDDHEGENLRIFSPFAEAPAHSAKEHLIRSLAVAVMEKVDNTFVGSVGRFSQVQLGTGNIAAGDTGSYKNIGIAAGGWETVNFAKVLRPDVIAVIKGSPVTSVNPHLSEGSFLKRQIHINRVALFEALISLADFAQVPPTDDSNFCDYPLASGLIAELPEEYWGHAHSHGEQLVPISPEIGVPLFVSGSCP